jgi:hypothetical protein
MFKDLSSPAVAGPRINVTEPYDVRRWADRFGCSSQALRDAVTAVGNVALDVQRHLVGSPPAADARAALEAAFSRSS